MADLMFGAQCQECSEGATFPSQEMRSEWTKYHQHLRPFHPVTYWVLPEPTPLRAV